MYQCSNSPRSWWNMENTAVQCLHFDVCWGSLGASIFGNSSSAANNTRSKLPSRLSFRFFWLWLKSSGWMTVIYFFLDICVFWVLFTSVRVTLELPAINVEKPLRWRLHAFIFFAFTEKNISLFGRELLTRQLSIQSVDKFLENCDQISFETRSFSALFQ